VTTQNNLTRDEARARAALLEVTDYRVDLDLCGAISGAATFRSTTTIRFACRTPGADSFVDLTADRIRAATLNGSPVDVAAGFDGHRLRLAGLAADNELRVDADCVYNRTGEGLHRFTDPVDDAVYLYSQFETFDAHRMYACFDQPDLKASFQFNVTAPQSWTVVSNYPGRPDPRGNATSHWTFEPTARISSYVTAVVAGPYHFVRDEHDGIELGLFCRASLAEHLDAEELFTLTKQGFDFFHDAFGRRYPFGKYDQLFVPEFNAGAMENVGCVTFLEDYVFRSKVTDSAYERRAETLLHEMAHMWFGNLVTMRWWDDLWLNESFASYVSVLAQVVATRFASGWTTFANLEKSWAYRQDQLPSTHPIAADIVDIEAVLVNFDGITYAKGASALKQLVAYVGHDPFFAGLRNYFERFAYQNTALADLLEQLEAASGRELTGWSKEWLETAGLNTLRPQLDVGPDGTFTAFTVVQEAPEEHPTLRTHRIAIGLYDLTGGRLVRRTRIETDVSGAATGIPQLIGVPRPSLVLLNDDDLTYAKIRLDEHSLGTLLEHIGGFEDSLPRALCWGAAWDMTRDAELAASDYVGLVLSGIGAEDDIGLVQSLQRLGLTAINLYAAPEHREPLLTRFAAAARASMLAAEPAGDHQLAWVRAFASAATSPADLDLVEDLLAGRELLPGLVVDAELRWHLLRRLVVIGRAGDVEIDAELARDATAAGARHAAGARAARPSGEAKAEAWRLAVDDETVPNAIQSAIIGGFAQIEQPDVLRPFVERYFAEVGRMWEQRPGEMAQNVAVGLYPGLFIEPATIERSDRFLRETDPPPALRRLILEGRAGVVRVLNGRSRDARC